MDQSGGMFERFTAYARRAVVTAQEEARELNHNYIGTEHILLALLRRPEGPPNQEDGIAPAILEEFGMSRDGVREEVIAKVGMGKGKAKPGHIPFTPRAKKVLELALREALQLHHNYIGTEHILLALLRRPEDLPNQEDGIAPAILEEFGMSRDGVREEVIAKVGMGKGKAKTGHIPFTPRAKKVLELALREALQLHHNYIGTEHLLLGLIREDEGVAVQIMRTHTDLLTLRAAVLERLPAGDADEGALAAATGTLLRRVRARLGGARDEGDERTVGATPATDATLAEAARLAGDAPVGSHHLLLAALADPNSAAARTLAGLGVDLDQARESLRTADVTGTTDEPPEEAGRRQMSVQVTDETLTVVIVDPVLVRAGKAALDAVNANAKPGGEDQTGETDAADAGVSATTTVIRGDHPAAASLAAVWTELHKSLGKIAGHGPSSIAA
jgi:ATP-dependent Clp protease ATP-binding subunit ClpA